MAYSSKLSMAIHTILYIRQNESAFKVTSKMIAESVNVNPVIIRRLVGDLKKAGIIEVDSKYGGAHIAKDLKDVTMWDVFVAVEDESKAMFGFHEKPSNTCPVGKNIHAILDDKYEDVQKSFKKKLNGITLADLYRELKSKNRNK